MKIAVGLSGGVDSSVAALTLKEQGHEVVGITMKLWHGKYRGGTRDACFGPGEADDIERARSLAHALGIGYEVFDCGDAYERAVIDYFRETTLRGETPNPCVMCNAALKFGLLPQSARASGLAFDRFATGHYARIVPLNGRLAVQRAVDEQKDQSYFLYRLSQEQLAQTLFPLGGMTKPEVRKIAADHGLAVADQADSQDFYSGDKAELIGQPAKPGDFVDVRGHVLGQHTGYWHYTIGQRRGFGVSFGPEKHYVIRLDACHNRVVVGTRADAYRTEFTVKDVHWMGLAPTGAPIEAYVKVRSTGRPIGPVVFEGGACRVLEGEGVFGVAPGQSAVFYDAEGHILCGGVIQ